MLKWNSLPILTTPSSIVFPCISGKRRMRTWLKEQNSLFNFTMVLLASAFLSLSQHCNISSSYDSFGDGHVETKQEIPYTESLIYRILSLEGIPKVKSNLLYRYKMTYSSAVPDRFLNLKNSSEGEPTNSLGMLSYYPAALTVRILFSWDLFFYLPCRYCLSFLL